MKCEYDGCDKEEEYPIYRLKDDGTKVWKYYCDQHERIIVRKNAILKAQHPNMTYLEKHNGGI